MAELMLVNPRRRRRVTRARRNPRKARRHMTALQRKYFGPRRKKRTTRRRRTETLAVNPRRTRRRTHRRMTHLRRNPRRSLGMGSMKGFINSTLVPASVGALGALGTDIVIGYVAPYLPASLNSGIALSLVKIAGAVGVGYAAGMFMGRKYGEEAMAGAITVQLFDIVKGYMQGAMPSLPISGYNMGWVSPAPQMGYYAGTDNAYNGITSPGVGMYIGETEGDYVYS